jgi:hypothetical protein
MKSTYIPGGFYLSKSQAAKILKLSPSTVQHHISKGNLASVNMPDLGHHILESDVLEFQAKLPGRPSIYPKK